MGGRSALGEAFAHASPACWGGRSTQRGYAPLESSGNGCLRQPMQTFFYCDSNESQQRGKTPRVKMLVKNFKQNLINFLKFKGTIIQSTEIVIMLQFLGPEMESSISQMFRPRNCGNAAVYFWAQKLSKCCNLWAHKMLESCNFWLQKLQISCNLISWPGICGNAAISGPRNCGYV